MSFLEGTAIFTSPGIPTQDPDTLVMIYPEGVEIIVTNATFTQLSSTEIVQRQQLQDDSTHKVRIDLSDTNKTIDHTFTATVEDIDYKITGNPKHPVMGCGRITIYLKA